MTPQQLADMWYLHFGHAWVMRNEIGKDWKDISETLMKNNLADYDLVYGLNKLGMEEIIKLKESCR